jgi:DNA-binding NtrC family response regulator
MQQSIDQIAPYSYSVLIHGESGSGKELVAREIHRTSGRTSFVAIDCTSLTGELFASELFGHERGAFTGAVSGRVGLLESAGAGTVFLDEIGELSLSLQARLLRFLQEKEFRRLGSNSVRQGNCRILAATHRDLRELVAQSKFREDLYHRLQVLSVIVPPLRERLTDIPDLIQHFQEKHNLSFSLSTEALVAMYSYRWPGNIRELEHLTIRLGILHPGSVITSREIAAHLNNGRSSVECRFGTSACEIDIEEAKESGPSLRDLERIRIHEVLAQTNGRIDEAAAILGIGRTTLYRRLRTLERKTEEEVAIA